MKKLFLVFTFLFLGCAQTVKVNNNQSKLENKTLEENREILYKQYLGYAARYITLGNFDFALDNIREAEKYKNKEDPYFYEIRGTIYDGLEEKEKAYNDFYKAMVLYYQNGSYQNALRMLGYLQAIRFGDSELEKWEKKIKIKLYQKKYQRREKNEKN